MPHLTTSDLETFVQAYIEAAFWASVDGNEKPMDENYEATDLAPEALASLRSDCEAFCAANTSLLHESGGSLAQHGHDFWLTRNGHGAGFWDRGYGAIGERLSEAAKAFGSADLYVGDDGKIWA